MLRLPFRHVGLLVLLTAPSLAQQSVRRFVERPGELEFSGQLIVRPLQPHALAELGLGQVEQAAVRANAGTRLGSQVIEHVQQTDEYIIRLPDGMEENEYAAQLMATGEYEYAEPNWICFPTQTIPNDPSYGQQWHHAKVRSALAWDLHTGSSDVVVAIVDGGVMLDHTDLAGALVPG